MKNLSLFIFFLSLTFLCACPFPVSNEDEEIVVEEEIYGESDYEYEEEDGPTHIENPADIAGSLIF
jgi:hypothetical protein